MPNDQMTSQDTDSEDSFTQLRRVLGTRTTDAQNVWDAIATLGEVSGSDGSLSTTAMESIDHVLSVLTNIDEVRQLEVQRLRGVLAGIDETLHPDGVAHLEKSIREWEAP